MARYGKDYGSEKAESRQSGEHSRFRSWTEAQRACLNRTGWFAKIKDYVHNHRYQWNLELFNAAVRGRNGRRAT